MFPLVLHIQGAAAIFHEAAPGRLAKQPVYGEQGGRRFPRGARCFDV